MGLSTQKLIKPIAESGDNKEILEQYKRLVNLEKTTDNYPPNKYFPQDYQPIYNSDLGIDAKSYLVYDKTKGRILYGENITEELPIASLTKIMTATVVLDKTDLDKRLIVPEQAIVGEAFMGLEAGESVRVEDLLYGLMLPSGNDAAETLAYGVGGGESKKFVQMMNEKAQNLGMKDTYFVNPSGLDGEFLESTSFSTALDLLALTNYSLESKIFRTIVGTKEKVVPQEKGKHKAFFLFNKLGLDNVYPAIKGVKPGTTELAGNCLVSYAEKDGQEYIIILLNAPHTRDEAVKIYERLYSN